MADPTRANDVKASNLYLLSTLLSFIGSLYAIVSGASGSVLSAMFGMLLCLNVLAVGVGAGIRVGYLWAKAIFLVLFGWGILTFDFFPQHGSLPYTLLELATTLLDAWAAFLISRDLLRQPGAGATH